MSRNNGIYILRTKDQYRVAALVGVERAHWSYVNGDCGSKLVPTRVVEMWGECKCTSNPKIALNIACKMEEHMDTEYGITIINYKKKWKDILKEASIHAQKEILMLKQAGENDYIIAKLVDISNIKSG